MRINQMLVSEKVLFDQKVSNSKISLVLGDDVDTEVYTYIGPTQYCSETELTGETRFHCESGCIPRMRTADPLDGKQMLTP
jgi:hypothetical protein